MYDFIIIGGGIVGLSVGMNIYDSFPNAKVLILEKEKEVAQHQTGHNSGVIHSGIYYKPGSYKAEFAKSGSESMRAFSAKNGIKHDICGKVIVATKETERPLLENLYKRGLENGLPITKLNKEELLEKEPNVNGIGAIHVPMAGIVDYKQVSEKMAEIIKQNGGDVILGNEVKSISEANHEVTVETGSTTYQGKLMINCAGLQSDRIAKMTGYVTDVKIVPFRGEYYKIRPEKQSLVNNLVYPVPNPDFPFLGVHFTRMVNNEIEVGPNAVLGFKREGYKKTDFNLQDFSEIMTYKGFWSLAFRNMREGMNEMFRSFVKSKFTENAQHLIPALQSEDLIHTEAGVRAQALKEDGSLVDDFFIINGKKSIHVCNAPSPAATASIEIGREIVRMITAERTV
ncbi:L-2-hydroxyglutarate oxidase [Virgibacillus sp. W0181]|uniref:L-2-hydroxyglutarate oxidase n=1 Tax=Virgibacillus sp. W0181 TaxID=3391581 RepID=UPI003F44DAC0